MKEERHAMTLRLPVALADEIRVIADQDRRKISATVEIALEEYVRQRRLEEDKEKKPLDRK